jgi:predicted O-linked N-acetylglucosamine transferase (SPINDLY family)
LDYLISDPTVVPSNERAHYSEHLITLPGCYQVNDDRRSIEADPGDRAAWILPDDALVLCAFHPTYKLNPALFDIWMRVLRRLDDACLWLLSEDPEPQVRLRAEAAKRNVDPQRLVFARRVAPGLHLARHRLADLYLDAWPYNAHTSASDALWAGLPVIAMEGRSFAARVSSSILRAAGLDAWIARSLEQYEDFIIALGTDRKRLSELRANLERDIAGSPLFNSLGFTRALEEAYTLIHQRHEAGLPPGSIEVPTWSRTDRKAVRDCHRP